jgi:predicted nucleic acid-binding protein
VGAVVLDASVVLALLDPEDALHQAATHAVRQHRAEGARFVLPASVLAEVLVGVARLGDEALDQSRSQIVAAFGTPVPLDESVAVNAARLRARHRSLRLPDAVVLATAQVLDAHVVLTGDRQWDRVDSRVKLIHPAPDQGPARKHGAASGSR